MRLVKMLGLAALAAVVAMAFVGASTASAEFNTVLCKKAELECKEAWPNPTEIHLHAVEPKLLSSLGTILCKESLALITLLNKLAVAPEELEGHVLSLSFSGECHLGETECTVETLEVGGLLFLKIGELEAEVTNMLLKLPEGEMNTKVLIKCGSFVKCTFSAGAGTKLTATSSESGHLLALAEKTPLAGTGFLCPKEGLWDADYKAVDLAELKLVPNLYIES